VWLVLRHRRWDTPTLRWVALGIPAAIAIGLFLALPTLSIDTYSYLSHGYLAQTQGSNPYVDPSASVAADSYGGVLASFGWQAVHGQTPYGPLWTGIERLAYAASGDNVGLGIRLIKIPELLAYFGIVAVAWAILGRVSPERRLLGVLAIAANPLVLVEFAGDGHNDGLMIAFTALALYAAIRRWPALAIVALALGVLVKPTVIVLCVPIAAYLIAHRRSWTRLAVEAVIGLGVSLGLAVALFAPYWVGFDTFNGLRTSGSPGVTWSVSGWINELMASGQTAQSAPGGVDLAGTGEQLVLTGLLFCGAALSCVWAWRNERALLRSASAVALLALLLLPAYWPWYSGLPLVLLALTPGAAELVAVLVLTIGSRLVAGFGDEATLSVVGYDSFGHEQTLIGQTLPSLTALIIVVSSKRRRRREALAPFS
jgi:hypothetical protein